MNNISQELREIANEINEAMLDDSGERTKFLNNLASQLEWISVSEHGNPKEFGRYEVTITIWLPQAFGTLQTIIHQVEYSKEVANA